MAVGLVIYSKARAFKAKAKAKAKSSRPRPRNLALSQGQGQGLTYPCCPVLLVTHIIKIRR